MLWSYVIFEVYLKVKIIVLCLVIKNYLFEIACLRTLKYSLNLSNV